MLYFPQNFFEPEIRSGYFVSEKMKRFWAASIEVLARVQMIAEKHGFTLYADFGTLLGAIRHGGFIPWDDDIDVSMLRNEYDQLMPILQSELPNEYIVYTHLGKTIPHLPKSFVANSSIIATSSEFLKNHHGCPYITGIDIFPIDTIPDDEEMWTTLKALYNVVYDAAFSFEKYQSEGSLEGYLCQIEELLNVTINRSNNIKSELWKLSDRVASLFCQDEGQRLCYMADIITGSTPKIRKKSWYASSVYMNFENIEIAVPIGYHQILKTCYGDYARIIRGRSTHNYPVYKLQDSKNEFLEKHFKLQNAFPVMVTPEHKKGNILFLIREADKWSFFENLYKTENNGINNVKIIVLPYHFKDELQRINKELISEASLFRSDLPIINPDDYDIKTELPERVYIQDPYDSYSISTEISSDYFTENIRPYAKEIVLVIPFDAKATGRYDEMQKEMFRSYLNAPGCLLADRIIVSNEELGDLLSEFESITNKISINKEISSSSDRLSKKNKKKNILFSDDISHFVGNEAAFIIKYSSIIRLFEENTDKLNVFWHLAQGTSSSVDALSDDTRDIYISTLNELIGTDWCTVIENASEEYINDLINIIDAAYGAPGTVITKCMNKRIPVMIWDVDII